MRALLAAATFALTASAAWAQDDGVWRGPGFHVDYAGAGWHPGAIAEGAAFAVRPPLDNASCALFAHDDIDVALPEHPITSQAEANAAIAARSEGRDEYSVIEAGALTFAENLIPRDGGAGYFRSIKFAIWNGERATLYDMQCASADLEALELMVLMPLIATIQLD